VAKNGAAGALDLPGFCPAQVKLPGNKKLEICRRRSMARVAVRAAEPDTTAASVIDEAHLKRMTYGDESLERELLQLFARQIEILVARMRASDAAAVATLAHTLKGSASGVGALHVAHAAQAAELAAARTSGELDLALAELAKVGEEARALIAEMLRLH
jgi:HPt (histidine-containing phosphotransfer) domain-containing protein